MQIEKITWETYTPNEFPCMVCNKNRAEWRGQFGHKEVTVNLCLCNVCINLPETELIERIFGEYRIKHHKRN